MHHARPNSIASTIVDEGLALFKSQGRFHAAHFMHEHGIAFRVIVRVLAPGAHVRLR